MSVLAGTEHDRWPSWPWDARVGERPRTTDTAPAVTADGDVVVYHGTSPDAAMRILAERRVRPDDLDVVGIGSTPGAVRVFGIMKAGSDAVVLRLVLSGTWLEAQRIRHEVGGSGHDQFLLQAPHGMRDWSGVPPEALVELTVMDD